MLSAIRIAVLTVLLLAVAMPVLAKKKPAPAALTPQGEAFKAGYTRQMETLQSQLVDALPRISDQAKAQYQAALDAESKARAGVITIPAAAAKSPNKSTGKVLLLDNSLGGKQMHYARNGGDRDVIYEFEAPEAGAYVLTMRVAVPAWKQNVNLIVNGNVTTIELPHTVGMWQATEPAKLQLNRRARTPCPSPARALPRKSPSRASPSATTL